LLPFSLDSCLFFFCCRSIFSPARYARKFHQASYIVVAPCPSTTVIPLRPTSASVVYVVRVDGCLATLERATSKDTMTGRYKGPTRKEVEPYPPKQVILKPSLV
jgi:hypothetical protein